MIWSKRIFDILITLKTYYPETKDVQKVIKMRFRRYSSLFAALLFFVFSGILAAAEKIRISTGHWPPYLDQSMPGEGFLAQIIREAFQNEDIEVEFSFLPWSRALAMVEAGRYAASAVWSCTESRSREFVYSAPILPYQYVFYYRTEDNFDWVDFDDLRGKNIGLTQDYSYGETLGEATKSGLINADVTTSDFANFKKLLIGRIDLFPMDPVVGEAMIENRLASRAPQLSFHPKPLRKAFYHLLFDKDNSNASELRRAFNRGLSELRESGRYETIILNAVSDDNPLVAARLLKQKLTDRDGDQQSCPPPKHANQLSTGP